MTLLLRNLPGLIGVAAVLGLLWAYGAWRWQAGYDARGDELAAETAARQARLDDRAADLRAREVALERRAQDRVTLERKLSDEAYTDPMAADPGLSINSLRRLNEVR